jgi:hypothetical protein
MHGFDAQIHNVEFAGYVAFQSREIQADILAFGAGKTIIIDTLGHLNIGVFPDKFAVGFLKLG